MCRSDHITWARRVISCCRANAPCCSPPWPGPWVELSSCKGGSGAGFVNSSETATFKFFETLSMVPWRILSENFRTGEDLTDPSHLQSQLEPEETKAQNSISSPQSAQSSGRLAPRFLHISLHHVPQQSTSCFSPEEVK